MWLASILVVMFWGGFLYTGTISTLYVARDFKSALATTALAVGTAVILRLHPTRRHYALVTAIPMLAGGNDADRGLAVDLEQLQPRSEPGQSHRQQWLHGDLDGLVSLVLFTLGVGHSHKTVRKGPLI